MALFQTVKLHGILSKNTTRTNKDFKNCRVVNIILRLTEAELLLLFRPSECGSCEMKFTASSNVNENDRCNGTCFGQHTFQLIQLRRNITWIVSTEQPNIVYQWF